MDPSRVKDELSQHLAGTWILLADLNPPTGLQSFRISPSKLSFVYFLSEAYSSTVLTIAQGHNKTQKQLADCAQVLLPQQWPSAYQSQTQKACNRGVRFS